jgi:TPR repeat protein
VALLGLAMATSAPAQITASYVTPIAAPDYGSGASVGALSNGNFNTPESDGRPSVKFFTLGVQAFRKGDYRHAIDMYKVAASWAYKPAEYNLAVMYFKGQGVPVDRPLGAAWMVLAAERGESPYSKARDLMVTVLSKPEFARTDELWGELKKTYGDQVALRRARAQWAWVKTHQTGTRVGGTTGELFVGVSDTGGTPVQAGHSGRAQMFAAGWGFMQGGSVDGSVAYRQFRQSDNPYDPVFLKQRTGKVKVEPLQVLKGGKGSGEQKPIPSSSPQQPPRSA